MQIRTAPLQGVLLLIPDRHQDERGMFCETYSAARFREAGIDCTFVQDSISVSRLAGTLRGLHCQVPPYAQDKLVRVARGAAFDVVVDIRAGSPTCGQHFAVHLDSAAGTQLFVPKGFLHGFCTLEPETEVVYKLSALYSPEAARTVSWNDPDLAIEWPAPPAQAILSARDAAAPRLRDVPGLFDRGPA